jgi:heme/copper-type cytochrome/quinol oxidase subunit 4
MCFSAPASFIASGGLAALGGASFVVAKKEDKVLAAIPLLFAIQQLFEGIQWLHLNTGSSSPLAAYIFLFFAYIVWPIYVPTCVLILDKERRKIMQWFILLGIIVAAYSLITLTMQSLEIQKLDACIAYTFNIPFGNFFDIAYLSAIFVPLIISSREIFRWFGVAVTFFAIISWLFFALAFTSVWCFFAAIVSSMFFVYISVKDRYKIKKIEP